MTKNNDIISWEVDDDFFNFVEELERLAYEPEEQWIKKIKDALRPELNNVIPFKRK